MTEAIDNRSRCIAASVETASEIVKSGTWNDSFLL